MGYQGFFYNPITLEMANTVTLIFTIKKIVLIVFGIWKKHWTGSQKADSATNQQ